MAVGRIEGSWVPVLFPEHESQFETLNGEKVPMRTLDLILSLHLTLLLTHPYPTP